MAVLVLLTLVLCAGIALGSLRPGAAALILALASCALTA